MSGSSKRLRGIFWDFCQGVILVSMLGAIADWLNDLRKEGI